MMLKKNSFYNDQIFKGEIGKKIEKGFHPEKNRVNRTWNFSRDLKEPQFLKSDIRMETKRLKERTIFLAILWDTTRVNTLLGK